MRRDQEGDAPSGPLQPNRLPLVLDHAVFEEAAQRQGILLQPRERSGRAAEARDARIAGANADVHAPWGEII